MEPEQPQGVHRPVRNLNWTTIALAGGLVLLILLIAYFATNRNPQQDKLTTNQVSQAQPPESEKSCASRATYDLIKRELFRRAAQLRGSDQAAYDRLSAYAVVRMENPVMESQDAQTRAVNCSASLSLDLPPGVVVVGGRHTLMSDIDYTIQPAADGTGPVVLLRNADAVIAPLATLAHVNQPVQQTQPLAPVETNAIAPTPVTGAAPIAPQGSPPAVPRPTTAVQPASPPRPVGARPSFDCAKARTKSEISVCSDAGLATLDRNMAAQFNGAMAAATPEQQAMLRHTRGRFLGYRDRCPNKACIGDAYVGRMREIRDIMEGRWQSPR